MTQQEIEEGNKLIADFQGFEYDRWLGDKQTLGIEDCRYHTSWEWLMPIVEKIESIYDEFHGYFGVYISSNSCTIQGTRLNTSIEKPHYAYHNDITLNTKIESTWYAVVQFIKWLNLQQSTN